MKLVLLIVVLLVAVGVVVMSGCVSALRSDSENALRSNAKAIQEALRASKLATSQAAPAPGVGGDALVGLLSGNTYVDEYRKRVTDPRPYFTIYEYFGAGGTYIVRDTYSRRTASTQAVGRWRVAADVLCIQKSVADPVETCFTVRLTSAHAVEFWNHNPGDPFHGLIASSLSIVRAGLQEPEYVTTLSPYER